MESSPIVQPTPALPMRNWQARPYLQYRLARYKRLAYLLLAILCGGRRTYKSCAVCVEPATVPVRENVDRQKPRNREWGSHRREYFCRSEYYLLLPFYHLLFAFYLFFKLIIYPKYL